MEFQVKVIQLLLLESKTVNSIYFLFFCFLIFFSFSVELGVGVGVISHVPEGHRRF